MGDTVAPLATVAQVSQGAFADLVRAFSTDALDDMVVEATRLCEDHVDRRLAPFAGLVETQRAEALDIEDALDAYVPLDPTAQLGFSRAQSLGSTLLVRHFWVRQFPSRYPEMWTGSVSAIKLVRSFSGTQTVDISQVQYETDTGHCRFQLGTFVPPGTTIVVTYSGGYSTMPASLVRAGKYMTASIAASELDPLGQSHGHDPDMLRMKAEEALDGFMRG